MSRNLKLKKIAIVAISALGLGMMAISPAQADIDVAAGSVYIGGSATATQTVNVGTAATKTFSVTTTNAADTNTLTYSIAVAYTGDQTTGITAPSNSSTTATAAAFGTMQLTAVGATTETGYTLETEDENGALNATMKDTLGATAGNLNRATDLRGSVSLNPDVEGSYEITLTVTATGGDTATATFTITAVSAATSFYVHANSAVSGVVKCSQTMTSNASTTITAGGGTCLGSGNIGQGVWTPEDGFMGTIEAVTTAGGGTVATLTSASPAQAAVQQAFYTGVRAGTSQRTLSGVNASAISSLTVETNAAGLLNLRWPAISGATAAAARALINGTQIGASDITAIATDGGILIPFTAPAAAGTYTVTIQTSLKGSYSLSGADTATTTITLVVTAAAADTYGSSTVTTTATAVDTAGVIYASSSALASSAVTFTVNQFDVNGTAYADAKAKAVTVTLSGVGSLTTSVLGTSATSYQAWAAATDATRTVELYGSGTAGTATLTFSVNGVNVATKTVKMYGAVATIEVTPVYTVAPDAGRELGSLTNAGGAVTTKTSTVSAPASANDPAFAITHKDSAGNVVPVVPSSMTSSNNGVIVSGITASFVDAGTGSYTQGFGVAHVTVSTAPAAKSGDKADITFSYTNSTGTTITATAVPMTVGGDLTKVTLTTDKQTYAPGEAMTLTFTGVDAAGNPAYDGQNAIYSLTSSKQMQNLPSSRYLLGGKRSSSSLLPVFAPAVSGPVTLNFIENTASLTKYAVTFTVSASATDAAAEAAADAAAEAIDAANAATDAANLAAEAADAATVAAEEARDAADAATAAVEELAAQFETLVASVKSQLNTLAATISKIAKRVKA